MITFKLEKYKKKINKILKNEETYINFLFKDGEL